MSDITVIIPTRNESIHIERAIKSALKLTPNVLVIDSDSTDNTIEIAKSYGVKIYQYKWTASSNFSKKINWAIDKSIVQTKWAIRLDADEYFMNNCIENLEKHLDSLPENVSGCTLIRRIHFMGKWMRYSGEYPKTTMRVFKVGNVEMENRWLDEHVNLLNGVAVDLPYEIIDDNKSIISYWINKHNNDYSNKEVIELLNQELDLFNRIDNNNLLDNNAQKKKRLKKRYSSMPLYWRAFFFFCYRYFFKFGFLDGKEGLLWNFFQCLWYRTLTDVKLEEIYKHCGNNKELIKNFILEKYQINCNDFNNQQ